MSRFGAALTTGYAHLAIATAIQVILIPFLLTRVGREVTGIYLLLTSIGQFAAIGIGWLAGAGVRVIGESEASLVKFGYREVHQAVFLGFVLYGALFLLGALLASAGIGTLWLGGLPPDLLAQIRLAVIFLGFYILLNYAHQADLALLVARLEQARANLYRTAAPALFVILSVPLMLTRPRIDMLFLAQLVSTAVCLVAARVSLYRRGLLARQWHLPDVELVRALAFRVGGPYFLFGVAQFVLQLGDTLLIGMVLGPTAVASYTVLAKAPDLIALLAGRISETLTPYFVKMDTARERQAELGGFYLDTAKLQHIIAILAGVGFATLGPWVLKLWVGDQNRPQSWLAYAIAGVYIFFQIVNRHDVVLHFACARVARVIPVQFTEAAAKLILTLLLFQRYDFLAPLIAYVIVQVAGVSLWYRTLALHIVRTSWRAWVVHVGRVAGCLVVVVALWVPALPMSMTWQFSQAIVFALVLAAIFAATARRGIMTLRALG